EMKVVATPESGVRRITKLMDPSEATGEYIGVTLIEPEAGEQLADALRATFERDPQLYYEDGYQELVDRGFRIDVQAIGEVGCASGSPNPPAGSRCPPPRSTPRSTWPTGSAPRARPTTRSSASAAAA